MTSLCLERKCYRSIDMRRSQRRRVNLGSRRILGVSAFYHEAAACLLEDGRLVAAAAEERFSRRKHDPSLPVLAIRSCLERAGVGLGDLDVVAYYERPVPKLARQLWAAGDPRRGGASLAQRFGRGEELVWADPAAPERRIRQGLGWEGPWLAFPHHACHAASAFAFSGFPSAAVLTVDGVGEWATTTFGRASRAPTGFELETLEEVEFPHSLGLLYSTLTAYLGFAVNGGEYKVMGLAPYGEPRFLDQIFQLVGVGPGSEIRLNLRYFDFVAGEAMFSPALPELFGEPPRRRDGEVTDFHRDLARSLQLALEEILLEKVAWLQGETGEESLCLAGGVALNAVANGRIQREGPFQRLFVQPAAGDAGGCLGAAALAHREWMAGSETSESPAPRQAFQALKDVRLGPSWSDEAGHREIAALLQGAGLEAPAVVSYRERPEALLEDTARRLAENQVVGWFRGPLEHGPRALGARSLLGNPLDPEARERLNRRVKRRESFRPFAPAVLAAHAAEHFDLGPPERVASTLAPGAPATFMLQTCPVRSALELPAVTHVDGSARPQVVHPETHPHFAALLEAFHTLTGCPMLVNTSFNVRGEPIVASPADALACFVEAGLDALVLEDFLLDASAIPATWRELLPLWHRRPARRAVSDRLYTFV